jgi:hypothetical protein
VQHVTPIAPGIRRVTTASHGGYRCTQAAQRRIETAFPGFVPWAGRGWYEEDCDWAVVALAHPDAFSVEAVYYAVQTILRGAEGDYFAPVAAWLASEAGTVVRTIADRYLAERSAAPSCQPRPSRRTQPMPAPFAVGDSVIMGACTDSFGAEHPDTPVLTVATVRLIEPSCPDSPHALPPYYRVFAYGPGLSSYEGAASCFRQA